MDLSYHITTWGCQMNEEDSEQIGLFLEQAGFAPAADASEASVVVLNTCSVRSKPEEKVWSELGRLKELKSRRNDMVIAVCGCMAQVESQAILERAPHVDLVIGTGQLARLADMVAAARAGAGPKTFAGRVGARRLEKLPVTISTAASPRQANEGAVPETRVGPSPLPSAPESGDARILAAGGCGGRDEAAAPAQGLSIHGALTSSPRVALELPPRKGAVVWDVPQRASGRVGRLKAHVPVMYGCDKFCTFCIVPFTRGRERSRPTVDILNEVRALAGAGTREVTLLGQTVNSYGKNLPEGRVPFYRLLEQIDAIPGIQRIRFTSPYPRDFTPELIDAIGGLPAVCEHVHLPLQVGDDELLAHMHRGYTVDAFRRIVDALRERIPGIAITTDLMLGYPGETEQQFRNTLRVVEEIRFDSAFMFAYSPRPNTKAADYENQITREVKTARLTELIELQNHITCEVNRELEGTLAEVLVEGRSARNPERLSGYTRTLKMVHFAPRTSDQMESLPGKLATVRLGESSLTGFVGDLVA